MLYQGLQNFTDAAPTDISTEEMTRRIDLKTKAGLEELVSLSSFTKKVLLYLAAVATLSAYLCYIRGR